MAYRKCVNDVLITLKNKHSTILWNKSQDNKQIMLKELLKNMGKNALPFDDDILIKLINEVYKGLTIVGYKVTLMDIDIELNEYDNDYDKDYYEFKIEL
jgi:hypothetical protein